MDRLLTQEEQYEAEHEWLFEWSDIPQEYKRDLLKAQDAKTASLVAQEIRQQIHYSHQAFTDKYDYDGLDPGVYRTTEYGEQIKGGGLVPAPKGDVMTTNIITGAGTYNQVFWTIKLLALVAGVKTLGELRGKR